MGKSASAACSVNPEKDVIADTMTSEEVPVHAEGEVKPSLQCELPSETVVAERDELQKQVQQLSQEMAQMKEVMSRKRSLPGLMYMKSKIVRKSKKSLKIEAKKKTGNSTKKTMSKDHASGSEDGANQENEQSAMSSLEIGNEPGKDGAAGTEDGANQKNEQSAMSSLEIGNEPGKDGVAGTEDGTKKTDVDLAMSPLKNAEMKDTKDDGTSIKKNEVYPTSNLGVHGEFRAAQEIMTSTDTTSHGDSVRKAMENTSGSLRLLLDDDVQTPELLTDVLKERSEGTELLLGQNAASTAADDIQKKNYVGPGLDDGDEYSDNECVVADSVSKEDSEKRTDANDVCANAKDLTEEKKTFYDSEKIDTMNPLPVENDDDLLGNQSEVAVSDLNLDEHQENKLLGEDNGNQTEANPSSTPTSDEADGNAYVDGEDNEDSERDESGFSADAVEDEVYDDGQDDAVEDDDLDPETGNGSHGPDATLMDSTYTGIGSMDLNSTVQSIGQISKPQQSSTPVRTESAIIHSPDNSTTPKTRTGIIAKENSVFYSKQQQKRRMASPTSTEVPVKIQAGIRNTGNQPNNAMTLLSPQQGNPVFHAQLQTQAQMSYGPVAGTGNWVPSQDFIRGNILSPLNTGSNYAGTIFGARHDGTDSARLPGFEMIAQNQLGKQMTDSRPNILTSKDLNIPATKSTSSTQTQKDVTANTDENDEGEETTWNIETDPFFSGTKLNIFL